MIVKRFDMHGSSHINGEYVSYSDCAKLESQLAALKEENERLKAEKVQINGKLAGSRLAVSRLEARVAELEPVEVVAVVTLGGIFHGGSGPELGDIDIEPSMSALEGIQLAAVHSDEDVHLDLMTVTQHERIVAAMAGQIDWQNITD